MSAASRASDHGVDLAVYDGVLQPVNEKREKCDRISYLMYETPKTPEMENHQIFRRMGLVSHFSLSFHVTGCSRQSPPPNPHRDPTPVPAANFFQLNILNSLDCFQRILVTSKCCQTEVSFPARSKSRSRSSDYICFFKKEIKEFP